MKWKVPKRPKGPMTSAQFGRGWTRAHNFDQNPGQPVRKAPKP